MKLRSGFVAAGFVLLSLGAVQAQTVMTGEPGRALYTYDKDSGGVSACYDKCAENWPPYLGEAGTDKGEGWTLVPRTDGTMQWAYQGKPVYYFVKDAPGHATGDGLGGVWHVLMQ
jgi:predicted lipoprotein with Yx(FWY)xxD motif